MKADPIGALVHKESNDPQFPSGMYTLISQPQTASPLQVAAVALQEPSSHLSQLEVRNVRIAYKDGSPIYPATSYAAVWVDTAFGQKVVLMQYKFDPDKQGWWARVYDVQ
jgi:hypothetical protein